MADELNNNQQQDSSENSAADQQQGTQQSQSPDGQGDNPGQGEKTFTQDEVNSIVQKRLEQQSKKSPSKEELEAFKKWQEDQKTAEEKRAEKDAEYNKMQAELNLYKNKEKVTKAGINPEFAEFAVFEVSKQVNDSTDFDAVLTSWIEANPQYKADAEPPKQTTGIRQGSAGEQLSGVEEIFKKKNPNLKF